jgi:hypothetical protein
MIYPGIEMQEDYDTTNPVASEVPPYNTTYMRYWLRTHDNQGGGYYNGTYTIKCESS